MKTEFLNPSCIPKKCILFFKVISLQSNVDLISAILFTKALSTTLYNTEKISSKQNKFFSSVKMGL